MLDRATGARILFYLAVGFGVWLWLSQIGNDHSQNRDEAAAIRQVEQVLAGHDAYAHRQAQLLARANVAMRDARDAKRLADIEGVARVDAQNRLALLLTEGDTVGAIGAAQTALAIAEREVLLLGHGFVQCVAAWEDLTKVATACEARADSLRGLLTVTGDLLKARRTFRLGFLTLPRPTKWQAGLFGCVVGTLLDTKDRLRGCAAGGFGTVELAPTR